MSLMLLGRAAQPAKAQISDGIVKIGVLNDETGPYANLAGTGSRVAALMAVEDFGAALDEGLDLGLPLFSTNKAGVGEHG